jgi:hypothetical protein
MHVPFQCTVNSWSIRNQCRHSLIRKRVRHRVCPVAAYVDESCIASDCGTARELSLFAQIIPALVALSTVCACESVHAHGNTVANLEPALFSSDTDDFSECLAAQNNSISIKGYLIQYGVWRRCRTWWQRSRQFWYEFAQVPGPSCRLFAFDSRVFWCCMSSLLTVIMPY